MPLILFGKKGHFFVYKLLVDFHLVFLINDPVIKFARKRLKKNYIIIDVGANLGTYAYSLSKKTGKNGMVYAFEPNPSIFRQLLENTKKIKNIDVINLAVSSERNNMDFYVHIEGNGPTSSLEFYEELEYDNLIEKISIETTTLDDFCKIDNIKPDLIKIDVEGHEYDVFLGCMETINLCKPVIIFEFIITNLLIRVPKIMEHIKIVLK